MYSIYQTHRGVTLVPVRAMQTTHTSLRGWKADIKTDGDMAFYSICGIHHPGKRVIVVSVVVVNLVREMRTAMHM